MSFLREPGKGRGSPSRSRGLGTHREGPWAPRSGPQVEWKRADGHCVPEGRHAAVAGSGVGSAVWTGCPCAPVHVPVQLSGRVGAGARASGDLRRQWLSSRGPDNKAALPWHSCGPRSLTNPFWKTGFHCIWVRTAGPRSQPPPSCLPHPSPTSESACCFGASNKHMFPTLLLWV